MQNQNPPLTKGFSSVDILAEGISVSRQSVSQPLQSSQQKFVQRQARPVKLIIRTPTSIQIRGLSVASPFSVSETKPSFLSLFPVEVTLPHTTSLRAHTTSRRNKWAHNICRAPSHIILRVSQEWPKGCSRGEAKGISNGCPAETVRGGELSQAG